jgi:hypothetical protein
MKQLFFLFLVLIFFTACNNKPATNDNTSAQDTITNQEAATTQPDSIVANPDSVVTNNDNNNVVNDAENPESVPLIIAGESVGKIALGTDASTLQNILGKPDMSDAAMGKAWTTWYGKKRDEHNNKTELDIYTAYKDTSMREQTVQQIRTTSSFFVTADSIHVYSSLDEIKNKYAVKKSAHYNSDGRAITLYDDKQKGIAFEIASANTQNICVGIIIHPKDKSVNDIYIMLHPDMKRFDK